MQSLKILSGAIIVVLASDTGLRFTKKTYLDQPLKAPPFARISDTAQTKKMVEQLAKVGDDMRVIEQRLSHVGFRCFDEKADPYSVIECFYFENMRPFFPFSMIGKPGGNGWAVWAASEQGTDSAKVVFVDYEPNRWMVPGASPNPFYLTHKSYLKSIKH